MLFLGSKYAKIALAARLYPRPLAAIYGPTSKCNGEEGGEGRKRKGRGWKRRGRKEREGRDTDWTDIQFNLRDATGKMQQQVCEA